MQLDKYKETTYLSMLDIFHAWHEMAVKLKNGEITEDEYNQWRYNYPEFDTVQKRAKIPSQELNDFIIKNLKEEK